MNDLTRKVDASFSPKSSPRGSRSPMANQMLSRNDSTGTLKMTISAGKHPAVVHSGPFYLMKVITRKPKSYIKRNWVLLSFIMLSEVMLHIPICCIFHMPILFTLRTYQKQSICGSVWQFDVFVKDMGYHTVLVIFYHILYWQTIS